MAEVKEMQLRKAQGRCFLVLYIQNGKLYDRCVILCENGLLTTSLKSTVSTWEVVENTDVDCFLNRPVLNKQQVTKLLDIVAQLEQDS